ATTARNSRGRSTVVLKRTLIGVETLRMPNNALGALAHLTRAIRAEHERWDGHGYPDGLAGENIPLPSRITLVCDAYHAMVSDRPYRKAMPVTQAREQIAAGAGSQFCPHVAHAFLHITDPNLSPENTTAAGR
ncbi:MAG TPA: HD domain-containing phosphohydrolase, partial [Candidatus Dormibacteraeota bacterium]